MLLVIMPVGVRIDGENDHELTIEGHAGAGQLVSVIRDCSGDPIASETSSFSDVAGALQYSHRFGEGNFVVLGLRAGRFQMNLQPVTTSDVPLDPNDYEYTYWNPHVAIEAPYIGFGIGYLSEPPVLDFGEWDISQPFLDLGEWKTGTPITAHLRLGNYSKVHFLATYNENLPMVSGGGNINLGLGYTSGNRVQLLTGLTVGPYDRPGLIQKLSWQVSDRFDLDLNGRIGSSAGTFEGSFSLGLRYHLPLGQRTGPTLFLEKNRKKKAPEKETGNREIG
jgi:hypothetical protein